MTKLRETINSKYNLTLSNYHEFYKWSCENYSNFWEEYYNYSGIIASEPYSRVVDTDAGIVTIPKWFIGARLNYAENLLRHDDDRVALYGVVEGRTDKIATCTFKEMRNKVAGYAAALRRLGVTIGDRVAGYLPNCIEAILAMLATASIGAIWSSASPDFGAEGVLSRFQQINPKILFTVNAVVYNGKIHDHLGKVNAVMKGLSCIEHVIIIPFVTDMAFNASQIVKGLNMIDFERLACPNDEVPELEFEQVPFDHPLFIMYSSGTTGAPKCMVHSVGGTLIQHLKEHQLHGNTGHSDILMYYTTTGWMMWNWMVSALALGCSLVLYDGSPLIPTPATLWDLVDKLKITIFGTGAKWLSVLEEKGVKPRLSHDLSSLHTILSTGSPLKPTSYDYVYVNIKDLVKTLKTRIRGGLSARHVPALILETQDIPYTISGKKVEVAVKNIINGGKVLDRGAFSNPSSLDLFSNIKELEGW